MVSEVRAGASQRSVARRYRVSLSQVQYWLARAAGKALTSIEWHDQRRGPRHPANRLSPELEERILQVRDRLRRTSDLGEYGAAAVQAELQARAEPHVPSARTIHRVFVRHGVLDGQQRIRRTPPPVGWYLPQVAASQAELDQVDVVEGLKIKQGPLVDVLTVVSLHGGLVNAWPATSQTAQTVRQNLLAHWHTEGLPDFVQFDNDTRFQGPHQHADVISSVMRLCLSLGLTPVFVPPRENGFQAAVESFNGRWQAKVWTRFMHESLAALQTQSARYVAAHRQRHQLRHERAPERRAIPPDWQLDLQARPRGLVIFVRRTNAQGEVTLLGHTFALSARWPQRLVRCEVDLSAECIRCYALRRRAPSEQPLLAELSYSLPHRRFRD